VPVNATLAVAVISLVLGWYMTTRDDGITLLSTLVNFGALSAFLLLHVSVVVHFVVRKKSRDWWRHLVVPVLGFAILLYVVINAQVAAQTLGFLWLGIGVVLLGVLLVTGRKPELSAEEGM
jgi:amino acid transporter